MKNINWKKIAPYLVAVVVFVGFAVLYCSPILEGKVLQAGDVNTWRGSANEALEYKQQTGETTWWTNSQFGGMPTYQITGSMPSGKLRSNMERIAHLWLPQQYAAIGLIFAYFCGFFLMLLCFGVSPWLSLVGAFAIGLSSYFLLIIPAGHMTKAAALGFLGPIIGSTYAIMQKKYYLGALIFLVYGFTGITLHPQMTYYVAMLIGVCTIAEIISYTSVINDGKTLDCQ